MVALFVRWTAKAVPISAILFVMNIVSFLFTVPIIMRFGWEDLKTKRIALISFRAVSGLCGFTFLFLAVQKISLTNALLLNNSAPLLLPIIIYFWLKTKIDRRLWISMGVGFLGICFILKPNQAILDLGAIYGVLAAVFLALGMVAVRLLSYTERHHTILFYYFLFASIIMAPIAFYNWVPFGFLELVNMFIIGALSFFGQLCFIRAFHNAKASQIGPFNYVAVIYGGILDWVFFHNVPDRYSIIGVILVCAGGISSIFFSQPPTPPVQKSTS